uniref:Uncharacterized protein n=1 Tax=Vespula pensylvanica TaxID=30213 RepID=A0A834NYY1_VESPE|nr:hypothetical protein H0235_009499 [Vespula pensylvanica]
MSEEEEERRSGSGGGDGGGGGGSGDGGGGGVKGRGNGGGGDGGGGRPFMHYRRLSTVPRAFSRGRITDALERRIRDNQPASQPEGRQAGRQAWNLSKIAVGKWSVKSA